MNSEEHTLSWAAIFRVIIAGVCVYLVWRLLNIILLILVSMMLAAAFYPIVKRLAKRMPIVLAAILAFSLLVVPLILLVFSVLPGLVEQFPDIIKALDKVLNGTTILPPILRNINLSQYAQNLGSYLLQSTPKITGFITAFLTVIFLALYFVADFKRLHKIILDIIPCSYRQKFTNLSLELIAINGQYIRGNLLISVICGIVIFIGLYALQVPFAASLALFAAIFDLLPLVGAFLGAVPAVIIGFAISPTIGLLVILLFIVYQQVENNILGPNIYNRTLDISPALSFIAVIIGATLFGIIGAFIALPVAASIPTIIKYIKSDKA